MPDIDNPKSIVTAFHSILSSLKDPESVEVTLRSLEKNTIDAIEKGPGSRWHPLSLSHGLPAGILLHTELDRYFPEEGWETFSHAYVLRLKEHLEKEGIHDLSIFSGLAGICFALYRASYQGTRYQKMLQTLESLLSESIDTKLLPVLEEAIYLGLPSPMEEYELISGLTGIGSYFLAKSDKKRLEKILISLISRSKDIRVGRHVVPGWYAPCHYQFTEKDKKTFPKGAFNLGMAHGVAGSLSLLSLAHLQGVEVPYQLETIEKIATWLIEKRRDSKEGIYWPDRISFGEQIGICSDLRGVAFDAWCYGSAGVVRALFLAGKALKKEAVEKAAIEGCEAIVSRRHLQWFLNTSSLCHGFAGTMLIMHLMGRDTGISSFKKASLEMRDILFEKFDLSSSFGFPDLEPLLQEFIAVQGQKSSEVKFTKVEKIGLLDGVCGILLALLAIEKGGTNWAAPFLIDRSDL